MTLPHRPEQWTVEHPCHLDGFLRERFGGLAWSRVRRVVLRGKVTVDDKRAVEPGLLLRPGQLVRYDPTARRADAHARLPSSAVVFVDQHVVVVHKPAGVSTVPFEEGERGTLRDMVRAWLNATAKARGDRRSGDLGVVHRIDKETSGLVVFTRNMAAKRSLANQFRQHSVQRIYLALAHGRVENQRYESWIVQNRGDGLRGSTRVRGKGKRAVTHVRAEASLRGATLVSCRLETGRTHQIRIHLSEDGHPLVGERVYVREYSAPLIQAPRLMLHAATLGFVHPARDQLVSFRVPPPDDFLALVRRLDGKLPQAFA